MGKNETTGQRALECIEDAAKRHKTTFEQECAEIGILSASGTKSDWNKKGYSPSAYYLQQMALRGYDIMYILTGEHNNGGNNDESL